MSRRATGILLIALAALCWGASATIGKLVFGGLLRGSFVPITPLVLAQTRTTIAFLLLAPALLVSGRTVLFRAKSRYVVGALLVGALGVSGSNFFYYYAIQKTSVGTAIVLQYLAPVWVLLYMVARGKQRATLSRVLGVALAVVGIALSIGVGGSAPIGGNPLGMLAAVCAGLAFALYNVGGGELTARISSLTVMLYAMLGSALLWAVVHPWWVLLRTPYTRQQWYFLVAFSIGSMLLPYLLYFKGLSYLDATTAIVTSCLEPVFAILLAVSFAAEHVTALQVAGIGLVIAATVLIQKQQTSA